MMRKAVECIWAWAERHGQVWLAKPLFRAVLWRRAGPVFISNATVRAIASLKSARRAARLKELGVASLAELEEGRDDLVSFGIFACNRFQLLKETCAALAAFLAEYGPAFSHEVLLFHDGQNEEIEAWANGNPLFDRIFFSPVNQGLSKNINRFRESSKGKYLLPIEDDWVCEYQDNFVANAIDILAGNADVGAVSFERREPNDYQVWNKANKMHTRVLAPAIYETPMLHHPYRLIPRDAYGNSSRLYRFSSLSLAGAMRDDAVRRRAQEGEYMKRYNTLWLGARGTAFKDSPFLHIGDGKSVPTWKQ